MASTLARAARTMTGRIIPRNSRPMSGGGGVEEVEKWKKISAGMFGLVVVMSLKEMIFAHEEHPHEGPLPDYMRYRAKPYPWVCSDCSLFDKPCFAKCKEQSG